MGKYPLESYGGNPKMKGSETGADQGPFVTWSAACAIFIL
jgi:hypothetical protein